MTTPSGQISLNDVNVELGFAGTTLITMNQSDVRTLAGVGGSGTPISMQNLQGKSNRVAISYTYSSNTTNASLNLSGLGGYSAGKTDFTITVDSGVYVYSTSTGTYALNLSGATTGDTVTIVNNGYIMGMGGAGGFNTDSSGGAGGSGGPAINLGIGVNPTITNTSGYIGGGGGAGGAGNFGNNYASSGGGGGAGGGAGGSVIQASGGAGGGPGATGSGGGGSVYQTAGGGGGGRILPGSGGAARVVSGYGSRSGGAGGGSGGSGGAGKDIQPAKGGYYFMGNGGGGGGGWGASGGACQLAGAFGAPSGTVTSGAGGSAGATGGNAVVNFGTPQTERIGAPGSGGKAVNLNGKSITWTGGSASSSRVYGAVS